MMGGKNRIFLMITLIAALVLVGCGSSKAGGGKIAQTDQEILKQTQGYTVHVSNWWAPHEIGLTEKYYLDDFTSKTKINFKMDFIPNSGYNQKVIALIAGGTPPDMINLEDSNMPAFVSQNLCLPLDAYMKRDNFSINDRGGYNDWIYNGKTMGIPNGNEIPYFVVNEDMFKKAGIPLPKEGWTWDEFLKDAQKLTHQDAAGNVTVWGFVDSMNFNFEYWTGMNGGKLFNSDTTKCVLDDPKAVKAMQFGADLIFKYKVAPQMSQYGVTPPEDMFLHEKAAIMFQGPWHTNYFRVNNPKFQWKVVMAPHGPDVDATQIVRYSFGAMIPKNAKNPEASWQVLKFWSNRQGMDKIQMQFISSIPMTAEVLQDETYNLWPNMGPEGYDKAFFESLYKTSYFRAYMKAVIPINIYNNTSKLIEIWSQNKPAQDVCAQVAAGINAEIPNIKWLEKK
jgi:multiple sugar transport system substrate-binding protein